MWWAVGAVAALSVLSTTRADRIEGKRRLARWNPVIYALLAVGMIGIALLIFGP